jgi:hypothetical protein
MNIDQEIKSVENKKQARLKLWEKLLRLDYILTFKSPQNQIFTVGPYQSACSNHKQYALIFAEKYKRDEIYSVDAMTIAFHAVEIIGRKKPINVSGERK